MNKLILVGRATKTPTIQVAKSGKAFTTLSIAVDDRGNETKPVDFFDIKCFGKVADVLTKFVKQGQSLLVEAKAKQNVYEKEDGTKTYSIDFILENFEFIGSTPNKETTEADEAKEDVKAEDLPF